MSNFFKRTNSKHSRVAETDSDIKIMIKKESILIKHLSTGSHQYLSIVYLCRKFFYFIGV